MPYCSSEVVLAATGRAPNVAGIGLEAAGVVYSPRGTNVRPIASSSLPPEPRRWQRWVLRRARSP